MKFSANINLGILRSKAEAFLAKHKTLLRHAIDYQGLSLDDM